MKLSNDCSTFYTSLNAIKALCWNIYSAFMLIKMEFMVILINIGGEMDQLNTAIR